MANVCPIALTQRLSIGMWEAEQFGRWNFPLKSEILTEKGKET